MHVFNGLPRSRDAGNRCDALAATLVTLEIDGAAVTVPEGTSIMRAAGVGRAATSRSSAPPDTLKAFGSCRLCLVEIEGRRGYPASCTTLVADGIKVQTESPKLTAAPPQRDGALSLRSSRSTACSTSASGRCELHEHGRERSASPARATAWPAQTTSHAPKDDEQPVFHVRSVECIVCSRCVAGVRRGAGHVRADDPGARVRLEGRREPERVVPGVGVRIVRRLRRGVPDRRAGGEVAHPDRPAGSSVTTTTCAYCGVGCSFNAESRNGEVVRMVPEPRRPRQPRPRLRQGPFRLRLRDASRPHHDADDPQVDRRSVAAGQLGSGHRPRGERVPAHPGERTAATRSAASRRRAARTKRRSSCRSWCARRSATTTSTPARASAIRRPATA